MSHPLWVRGLKHFSLRLSGRRGLVAPFVGAWIETFQESSNCYSDYVAPFVGAWIETGKLA